MTLHAAPLPPRPSQPRPTQPLAAGSKPTLRSQVPLLAGTLLVGIAGGWSLGALVYPGQGIAKKVVQRGQVSVTDHSQGWMDLDVDYAAPFAAAPQLQFDAPVLEIREARPDGFKVRIEKQATLSHVGWTAEGMPAQP